LFDVAGPMAAADNPSSGRSELFTRKLNLRPCWYD
jgi:hypothetical protein